LPTGHWANPGVVATGGRVYAVVSQSIAAVDQASGRPAWRVPLNPKAVVRSLAASKE
jgi:outer membrane protein assembly factor BamB